MYVWVKRRFAIDPCDVSPELGGWKDEEDKSEYCSARSDEMISDEVRSDESNEYLGETKGEMKSHH